MKFQKPANISTGGGLAHSSIDRNSSRRLRVAKFALVGSIGICLQLTILWLLNSAKMNYLLATIIAVELTVLHNFCWHRRFTWHDRTNSNYSYGWGALLRFHSSSGAVSLLGNVAFMSLLVRHTKITLTVANIAAITICAGVNLLLGDLWVFKSSSSPIDF